MEIYDRDSLIRHLNAGGRVKYLFFWGHRKPHKGVSQSCLSQWYEASFREEGHRFMTAEHYMMFHKARLFGDKSAAGKILKAQDPGKAKALGRQVNNFDSATWDAHKFGIVVAANRAKFDQNPELGAFLHKTGDRVLVEASPVDRIWGIGLAADDRRCEKPEQWRGENLLGFALMKARAELAADRA